MRKILIMFLIAFFSISFTAFIGCTPNNNANDTGGNNSSASSLPNSKYYLRGTIGGAAYNIEDGSFYYIYDNTHDTTYLLAAKTINELTNNQNTWQIHFKGITTGTFNTTSDGVSYYITSPPGGNIYFTHDNYTINVTKYDNSEVEGNFTGQIYHFPNGGMNMYTEILSLNGTFKVPR